MSCAATRCEELVAPRALLVCPRGLPLGPTSYVVKQIDLIARNEWLIPCVRPVSVF